MRKHQDDKGVRSHDKEEFSKSWRGDGLGDTIFRSVFQFYKINTE